MKRFILFSLVLLALTSCKKLTLDSFAFPSEALEVYEYENYTGGWNLGLPESALAEDSNYTQVMIGSYDSVLLEKNWIFGLYIGDVSTIWQDTVILYFHGQSKHMDHYFERASLLANVGGKYNYGVFMIDYRGYGMSTGKSTEQGLIEDANAAIKWLKSYGGKGDQTICYGYSLGAIPAIDRAAYHNDFKFDKLIVESPIASVEHLVESSTLINVSSGFMTTLEFPNAEKIKDVDMPLLWFHGVEDDYTAIQNGELIYENHGNSSKTAVRVEGGGHSDVPSVMGLQNYLQEVLSFIRN